MDLRCGNPKCGLKMGPAVGPMVIVSVGRRGLFVEDVLAVTCELCNTTSGTPPTPAEGEVAQDINCPGCGHKSGEMFAAFSVFSSQGRTVWARRVERIQCGRCDVDWEPRYRVSAPLVTSRGKRGGNGIPRGMSFATVGVGAPITRTILNNGS